MIDVCDHCDLPQNGVLESSYPNRLRVEANAGKKKFGSYIFVLIMSFKYIIENITWVYLSLACTIIATFSETNLRRPYHSNAFFLIGHHDFHL